MNINIVEEKNKQNYIYIYISHFSPSIEGNPSATSGERNWWVPAKVVTFNFSGEYLSNSCIKF